MKTPFLIKTIFIATSLTFFCCNDPVKINSPENTSRPAVPDNKGRNVGDNEIPSGTSSGTNGTIDSTGKPIPRAKIKI